MSEKMSVMHSRLQSNKSDFNIEFFVNGSSIFSREGIMNSPKNINSLKRSIIKSILALGCFPISCCLIGILAYQMRSPSPVEGSYPYRSQWLLDKIL